MEGGGSMDKTGLGLVLVLYLILEEQYATKKWVGCTVEFYIVSIYKPHAHSEKYLWNFKLHKL